MADDNKPLKHMRYAIGEIILVVIGILIALQINNWTEQKKEVEKFDQILVDAQSELVENLTKVNYYIDQCAFKD